MAMSEADTCRQYVLPKLYAAAWEDDFIAEQRYITDGRIVPVGQRKHLRKERLRPDYILYLKRNYPIAVVEAKAEYKKPGDGLQQAIQYAEMLGLNFAYATNGHGIVERDLQAGMERDLTAFPTPDELWERLRGVKQLDQESDAAASLTAYHEEIGGKSARYYQQVAINRAVDAVIKGQPRIPLTMATGTGKTFVAFQIVWRLWKAGRKKRILFLADRNVLIDQAKDRTFSPMGDAVVKIKGRAVKSREMYFALYQALANPGDGPNLYEKYPRDFFDLIIVDECHRGSAKDGSSWRRILEYFEIAQQIGLTATPKRQDNVDTYAYFGEAIYTYSLKQGIDDGFLAPYRVQRIIPSSDTFGVGIEAGTWDRLGQEIPEGLYGTKDFERVLSVLSRTEAVARHLTDFLKGSNRHDKTMVFCVDQEHAQDMRDALVRLNPDLVKIHTDYVARVVSDEGAVGRMHLDNFQDPEIESPVILTTSQMLTTGVDAPTCRNVVLFRAIGSMTDFKQIIGRGTRLNAEHEKYFFTILDYTGATELFYDKEFDGDPVQRERVAIDETGQVVTVEDETVTEDEGAAASPDTPYDLTETGLGLEPDILVVKEQRTKFYIDGEPVYIVGQQAFELDPSANVLRTMSFTDYVGEHVRRLLPTAQHLQAVWPVAEQRAEIAAALAKVGVTLDELAAKTARPDADPLDLLLHVAYNAPLLTRKERAEKIRQNKPTFFDTYSPAARQVLAELLDKYADFGLLQLEDLGGVLKVPPFNQYGTTGEIAALFGGAVQMRQAVERMKVLLYEA
ncbi:MAG: DEAD/DEAH box helicase family protein [Chloroflexi bacterium]|nr:DEAD/DEAH box helicase family protein [Chloroflexota bacterium]